MRQLSEEHIREAIAHVDAVRRIHRELDGVEWSPDTLDKIAEIIQGLGGGPGGRYHIKGPDEPKDAIWMFPATIYFTVARSDVSEDVVTDVTVTPGMGVRAELYNDDEVELEEDYAREQDLAEDLLGSYLSSIRITGEDFFGRDTTYPLRWES